ncbi:MAG: hypothetical protein M3R17_17205 [Bacteroidota bacterium]|nr:hypothetical protein [Bacteroidota bacterium]
MEKLISIVGLLFLTGLFSCSRNNEHVIVPSAREIKKTDSVKVITAREINSVEELLPELQLLKFPITIAVDSFKSKKTIPLAMDKNLPWFANSMEFPVGTKAGAVGKFYFNMKVIGVLFLVSYPGEFPGEQGKEEIILTLFDTEKGTIDSRTLAIKGDGMSGTSMMKNNEEGRKFVQLEMEKILITTQSFEIKDGKFILRKSDSKSFSTGENGRKESASHVKSWMK